MNLVRFSAKKEQVAILDVSRPHTEVGGKAGLILKQGTKSIHPHHEMAGAGLGLYVWAHMQLNILSRAGNIY